MKDFQDLYINGEPKDLLNTLSEIEKVLTNGWSRDHEAEERLKDIDGIKMFSFKCVKTEERRGAHLWIAEKKQGLWYVSNIVPDKFGELSFDQYNYILQEFTEKFVSLAAVRTGVSVKLTPPEMSIEDYLGPEVSKVLLRFSRLANRSILHPLDRKRWEKFIIICHQKHIDLNPDTLQRLLIEEEGWPQEKAWDLSIEYENARSLLRLYDEHR